jgi:hypothetical protein
VAAGLVPSMIALASVEERALINHHLSSLIYHHSEAQIRPFVAFVTFCKKTLTFAAEEILFL